MILFADEGVIDPLGSDEVAFSEVTEKSHQPFKFRLTGNPVSILSEKQSLEHLCLAFLGRRKLKRIGFETQGFEANLLF